VLPPTLEPLVRRALAKNPDERFPSAAEFADALAAVELDDHHGRPVTAGPPPAVVAPAGPPLRPIDPSLASTGIPWPAAPGAAPAGPPAPLPTGVPVAPAIAALLTATRERVRACYLRDPQRAQRLLLAAGLLLFILVVSVTAALRSDPVPADAAPVLAPAAAADDAAAPTSAPLDQARAAIARGDTEGAIALLNGALAGDDSAAVHALLGQAYFQKYWWRDGLKEFRAAMARDPVYREDETLIKVALRGLQSPSVCDALSPFLPGPPGTPQSGGHDGKRSDVV
jgi:serine/threonine-protein kinase